MSLLDFACERRSTSVGFIFMLYGMELESHKYGEIAGRRKTVEVEVQKLNAKAPSEG